MNDIIKYALTLKEELENFQTKLIEETEKKVKSFEEFQKKG